MKSITQSGFEEFSITVRPDQHLYYSRDKLDASRITTLKIKITVNGRDFTQEEIVPPNQLMSVLDFICERTKDYTRRLMLEGRFDVNFRWAQEVSEPFQKMRNTGV